MRIIVDANIVFSGILRSESRIGDLLINSDSIFKFIAPYFLRIELHRHHDKLMKISGLSLDQLLESEFQICKHIQFISEEQIDPINWSIADKLVSDVDEKDISYVAYSKQFKAKIWSGDKTLINGLKNKKFNNFVNTTDLWDYRQKKMDKK